MGTPERRQRRNSLRKAGYDYRRTGAYFVTLCTHGRQHLFGSIREGELQLSPFGAIVEEEWRKTELIRHNVRIDAFVVMPNHVHGIVWLVADPAETDSLSFPIVGSAPLRGATSGSLSAIIGQIKSVTTKRIMRLAGGNAPRIWQRGFYEHIIRSDEALVAIRAYIEDNPRRWHLDRYNPDAHTRDPLAVVIRQMLQRPVDLDPPS